MSYARKIVGIVASVALALPLVCQAGVEKGHEPMLVVVPAKPKLVQFCFDLALMRNITIVSYDKVAKTGKINLHVWDKEVLQWVKTSNDAIKDGSIFKEAPAGTVLIGTDGAQLSSFEGVVPGDVKTVVSSDIVNLASSMSEIFIFNANEWKWIAKRYEIEIKDLNENRRKYGRYGNPGETPMPVTEQEPAVSKPGPVLTPVQAAPGAAVPAIPVAPAPAAQGAVKDAKPAVEPTVDLAPVKAPEDK